jgi:predicted DCC family thiol-disulfide oxidoreductase YuxK
MPVSSSSQGFALTVFFDGMCPLCRREVNLLQRLDRHRRIAWVDIAHPDFSADSAASGAAPSLAELMSELHARKPDGEWIRGVEAFRCIYAELGFGALVAITRRPGVSRALEAAYRVFARNRLRLTGRCDAQCGREPANRESGSREVVDRARANSVGASVAPQNAPRGTPR